MKNKSHKISKMILALKAEAERLLADALRKTYGDGVLATLKERTLNERVSERILEIDIESEHADISSSVAFSLARILRRNPAEIASEIVENIELSENSLFSSVEAVGPYINFHASERFLAETLREILREGSNFGCLNRKGKVIIEHTSANPDGPLHIGHLRNAVVGDALARILRHAGYDVETQYYVNDMGKQVAILVFGLKHFKLDEKKKVDHAIADVYIAANKILERNSEKMREVEELMRKYEANDEETVRKYKETVEKCLAGIKETLQKLNIHHDRFVWESEFVRSGAVAEVIHAFERSGRLKKSEGAFMLELEGVEKPLVLQRSDGTSLYSTRDIAYHRWKSSHCDILIDVLGKDHELVAKQLAKALEILGVKPPEVVIFEFVSLPEGSLSTREGRFISADELIELIMRRAYEEVAKRRKDLSEERKREIAEKVGIGALKYDLVKVSPEKHIVFNMEDALNIEKKGSPFIQYAHARASSILRMAKRRGIDVSCEDFSFKFEEHAEVALVKKLAMLPAVVERACDERKPHIVAKFARELAEAFNQFYRDCAVIHAPPPLREARLCLVACVKQVLSISLNLLGIEAPEEM
ncbi:MAG: arginine--tRNA ligase [Candidatus Methanospirare jalkutatii]|nr:MAG: arginine--tRNA ligase [Candidatus Methanospirare jalkutatii]